jgi:hypothetical protein
MWLHNYRKSCRAVSTPARGSATHAYRSWRPRSRPWPSWGTALRTMYATPGLGGILTAPFNGSVMLVIPKSSRPSWACRARRSLNAQHARAVAPDASLHELPCFVARSNNHRAGRQAPSLGAAALDTGRRSLLGQSQFVAQRVSVHYRGLRRTARPGCGTERAPALRGQQPGGVDQ